MIALDASALIAFLDSTDVHHERAEQALIEHAGEPLCASVVTLAATLVGPARRGHAGRIRAVLDELGVEAVPLRPGAEIELASLRASSELRLPDCCVLLAARQCAASILSFDDRLRARAADHGLIVVSPG